MSGVTRLTGMVSGMDTDATVKKLIQLEQTKVDRAKQDKQVAEWQKEQYRGVANDIRGFKDEFFDLLKPDMDFRNETMFTMFAGKAMEGTAESTAVSIKTTATSNTGTINITEISQLATKDTYESTDEVVTALTGANDFDLAALNTALSTNSKFKLVLDGESAEIDLAGSYADRDAMIADINAKVKDAFDNVDLKATEVGGKITFTVLKEGDVVEEAGHSLQVGSYNADAVAGMGLRVGQGTAVNLLESVKDALGLSGTSTLKINDKTFTFEETSSVQSVISEINSSDIGVTITYDSFSDKFKMQSTKEGSANKIEVQDDASGVLAAMKLQGGSSTYTAAIDSKFKVDNIETTRSSNTVTINGTEVTLNELHAAGTDIAINITSDTEKVKEKIVKFVAAYNTLIEKINNKTDEKRYRSYRPLTTEQKKELSDDEEKLWNEKAQSGLLASDSSLERITRDMRNALNSSVDGLNLTMFDIGIKTSANYKDKGKLEIDEKLLDNALKDRPNEVIQLFSKKSSISYDSGENRAQRNAENGIANKLFDIIEDTIRITRNTAGNKGLLIDKAGSFGGEDKTSELAKKISTFDVKIESLLKMLQAKETTYYNQFARMESAMSKYNSQSQWLTQQFGG